MAPAGTLRFLLRQRGHLELLYSGFCLETWLRHDRSFVVSAGRQPVIGDLILCEAEGLGDIRRVLGRKVDGAFVCALDATPPGRETVPAQRVLAVVIDRLGAGGILGRALALAFPVWSRVAAVRYWLRKVQEMPDFEGGAEESVGLKYEQQVDSYLDLQSVPVGEDFLEGLRRHLRPGGTVLVVGCGTGREALLLARAGYRACGFDLVPAMVEASRSSARRAGLDIEFFPADILTLDLGARRFDGAYVTQVYSFVRGRGRRVEALRRLGRHLSPGSRVIFSAHLFQNFTELIRATLVWALDRLHARWSGEFGDWYTWFLTPAGTIGASFKHLSLASHVRAEALEAGYHFVEHKAGGSFVAGEFIE
jgi:SAM-dependent methyltransferase